MVNSCCAYGCRERFVSNSGVTFHSFPKDEIRRKLWLINLRRENFNVTQATKICSKHFTPDSFDREKTGGTWLRKDANPTVFNFPPQLIKDELTREAPVKIKVEITTPLAGSNRKKRKCYIGDFSNEDMDSPTKAREVLQIAKDNSKIYQKKMSKANRKVKRLKKQISSLQEKLEKIKKKSLISLAANNGLEINR